MRVLTRKTIRSVRKNLGQTLAVAAVIMCGTACLICFTTLHRNLVLTKQTYFGENQFADFEIMVERAPKTVLFKIEQIPGVRHVRGRVVEDVKLEFGDESKAGRLVSLPARDSDVINDIVITRGRYFDPATSDEVVLSQAFAEKNDLGVGDTVSVNIDGRQHELRVVGLGQSPEYLYIIRSIQDMVPAPERFGILWVSDDFAEAAMSMRQACNSIVGLVDDPEQLSLILDRADVLLDSYGVFAKVEAEDQVSNRFISDEIRGLESTARVIPVIFLGMASLVIMILLNRMVRNERTQIGLLKSYGYSNGAVAWHYLQYSIALALIGCVAGALLGQFAASQFIKVYVQFYQFPELESRIYPVIMLRAAVIAVFFAVAGAWLASRRAARIHPAESMRPEAPKTARRSVLERFRRTWARMSFTGKMIARNIARHPFRTGLNAFGVMVSCGLLIIGFFMLDGVDYLIRFQFEISQQQDAKVSFITERGEDALREVARYDHVRQAEPLLQYPFEMRHGPREKEVLVIGLQPGGRMQRLLNTDEREVPIPPYGIVLSERLASDLGATVGDELIIEPMMGKIEKEKTVAVTMIVKQYFGSSAYMSIDALSDVLDERFALNAVLLNMDPGTERTLDAQTEDVPAVATVEYRKDVLENLRKTLGQQLAVSASITILFAGIIAFAVIYNVTMVSLTERQRELASLRILGFSKREVGAILFRENIFTGIIGLAAGIPFGLMICRAMLEGFATELYRMPFYFEYSTLLIAAGLTTSFIALANLAVRRKLQRLDLIEVLKSRE